MLPSSLSTATTSAFKPVPILKHKESTDGAMSEASGGILKNPAQQTASSSKPEHVRIRYIMNFDPIDGTMSYPKYE